RVELLLVLGQTLRERLERRRALMKRETLEVGSADAARMSEHGAKIDAFSRGLRDDSPGRCVTKSNDIALTPLPASLDKTLELHGCSSHPLDHERNALADADAHGAERVTLVRSKQLIHRRRREARAACAEWMAQCDGAAIRIDVLRVIRDPEQAKHGERLRRKGFVALDDIPLRQGHIDAGEELACGGHGSDSHDARFNARNCRSQDPDPRLEL